MQTLFAAAACLACSVTGLSLSRRNVVQRSTVIAAAEGAPKKLLVIGGTGYVGREVCRRGVARGWKVTGLSRRGCNPEAGDPVLESVSWVAGDATDATVVRELVRDCDAVVHACGLLFEAGSGLEQLNNVVSGSKSVPAADSTYDRVTRLTAFNAIDAVQSKLRLPFSPRVPFAFVSAAEAGWPDVQYGDVVESKFAPDWLRAYLLAKRAVEAKLAANTSALRPIIYRPSLIWSWTKFDVLPIIPVFNIASALGVPFVDRTINVATLADAIVAGIADEQAEGVQRFDNMDKLAATLKA